MIDRDKLQDLLNLPGWWTLSDLAKAVGSDHSTAAELAGILREMRVEKRRRRGLTEYRGIPSTKPPDPTPQEILRALSDIRRALGIALKAGYKIKNPVALRKLNVWLRHAAGEDVSAEVAEDEAIPEYTPHDG